MKATKIIAMMLMAVMLLSIGVSAETVTMGEGDSIPLGKAVATPKLEKVQTREGIKAMEKFRELKQTREQLVEEYTAKRSEWLEAKKAYSAQRGAAALEKAIEKGKNLLAKRTQRIMKQLEMLKKRVEASKNMEDSVKATVLSKLDEYMTALEQTGMATATIETKEQLREASKALKEEWGKVLPLTKKTIGLIKSVKIRNVINKAEKVKEKITARIAKLEEAGQDTTALKTALESFETSMAEAKAKYEEAMTKFVEVETSKDVNAVHAEIKNLLKESNQAIKRAYQSLKTAVREIRQATNKGRREARERPETEEEQ